MHDHQIEQNATVVYIIAPNFVVSTHMLLGLAKFSGLLNFPPPIKESPSRVHG